MFTRFNSQVARPVDISVLNSILSVAAFLGNALILIALHKESSLNPPSKLLLRNLATTDLCVGLILELLTVICWMSVGNGHRNICPLLLAASLVKGYILFGVSVATLTAISVDRLLTLLLKLRYRQVVTLKRTYAILITLWVLPALLSAMWFWNASITLWYGIIGMPLCLIISIFSYTKIFLALRQHDTQIHNHALLVVTIKRTYVIVISIWVVCTVSSAIQFWNPLMTLWYGIIGASLCLVISSFCYTKIFLLLRHHQNKLQDPVQQPNQTN